MDVVDADLVCCADNGGLFHLHWHLQDVVSIHHNLGTWEDLELVSLADDSYALLGWEVTNALIVHDDAEFTIEEVTG